MDSRFYVSLEAARLLKEKGYNEECYCAIDEDSDIHTCEYRMNQDLPEWKWSCPTKSEAIDWLEGKNLTITIDWIRFNERRRWCYGICNNETCDLEGSRYEYITRLEAEDAAIIKACEFLENGN